MDEATVEHAGAKSLIEQLELMTPGDALYDAKVTVLGELIEHHVKEEEGEMFPKAKKAKLDLKGLATQMTARKAELKAELDSAEQGAAGAPQVMSGRKKAMRDSRGSATNGK